MGACVAVAVLAGEWQSNTTVRGDVTLSLCARPSETVDSNLHLSLAECFYENWATENQEVSRDNQPFWLSPTVRRGDNSALRFPKRTISWN